MKNTQEILTSEDFEQSKRDGEIRRMNKKMEKENRNVKRDISKNNRKRALQQLKLQDLEGDDEY